MGGFANVALDGAEEGTVDGAQYLRTIQRFWKWEEENDLQSILTKRRIASFSFSHTDWRRNEELMREIEHLDRKVVKVIEDQNRMIVRYV